MADISTPKEFLQDALELVDRLSADKQVLQKSASEKEQLDRALNTLRKNVEQEKTKTVNSRRSDIESEYNKKIKSIESEIEKIENRRAKARNEGVRSRVELQTAGLKDEIAGLREQLAAFCKENKISGLCKTGFFYKFFCPSRFIDWFEILIIAALMIGALAGSFYLHDWKWFAAAIGVDVLIIVIYVLIWASTKGKHGDKIKVCKQFIKNIRQNEKGIKNITKNIHKDKDDSVYDLGSYDTEIQTKKQEHSDIEAQKTNALYQFDNVTRQQLINEIDMSYAERLNFAAEAANKANAAWFENSQKVSASENMINAQYVQYIGSKNLNHEAISRMIDLVEKGEAISVSDAVSKIQA